MAAVTNKSKYLILFKVNEYDSLRPPPQLVSDPLLSIFCCSTELFFDKFKLFGQIYYEKFISKHAWET